MSRFREDRPPLGKLLAEIRERNGMARLSDLSAKTGYSTAFLSAIEIGRKPTNEGTIRKIAEAMGASEEETRQLEVLARMSRPIHRVVLTGLPTDEHRALVLDFLDLLPALTTDQAIKLQSSLGAVRATIPFTKRTARA